MSRLLVFGLSPLPFENERRMYGPGIRTWQFAKPLLGDGHDVTLVTMRIGGAYADGGESLRRRRDGRLDHWSVEEKALRDGEFLRSVLAEARPHAVIGATAYGAAPALRIGAGVPVWADVFGDLMAEAQAKAAVYDNDHYLVHFWDMLRPILDGADVFSSVSRRQLWTIVGLLEARGRLNKHSEGYEFIHTIPCGADEAPVPHDRQSFRGLDVPTDAFVVLWSGGYNTWTDVDVLFEALSRAMESNSRIRFVSTGGQIDGHDEKTYPKLLERIAASPFRDRFHMRGWIPTQDVPSYWHEADVGIHIDRPIYERMLGSENRVLNWLRVGLPVLTSDVSELSETIRDNRLGFVYPSGNAAALSDAILDLAGDPAKLRDRAERGERYAMANFTFGRTTEPLRRWAEHPTFAPDRGRRIPLEKCETPPSHRSVGTRFYLSLRSEGIVPAVAKSGRWIGRRLLRAVAKSE